MGFLSGLMGGSSTTVPASGFYSQPQAYQNLYNGVLGQANSTVLPGGQLNTQAFTPLPQTQDETNAFNQIRQGFTPTADSLKADLSMLQNPWEDSVLDPIQRSAQSDYSILKQNSSANGQFGSNRQQLGANDIENTRESTIGNLRSNEYNTAVGQVLNNLVPQRQADAQNLLGIGTFDRNLNSATQQAPYNALAEAQGALSGTPTTFGSFGTPQQTIKTGGGLGGLLGGIGNIGGVLQGAGGLASAAGYASTGSTLSGIGSALGFFSDRRLKQDIEFVGLENGHKVYEYSYKEEPDRRWQGVMADEVQEVAPHAVIDDPSGYKKVDYDMIGVRFREVA